MVVMHPDVCADTLNESKAMTAMARPTDMNSLCAISNELRFCLDFSWDWIEESR
jgi:hypothetical protein